MIKVVCIDNSGAEEYLTPYKIYLTYSMDSYTFMWIRKDDKGISNGFRYDRFITLAEYREQRINSILND